MGQNGIELDLDDALDADLPPIDIDMPAPEPRVDEFDETEMHTAAAPEVSITDVDGLFTGEMMPLLASERDRPIGVSDDR